MKAMKFILGRKVNMTQVFDQDGTVHPVTVVKAGPITITQVKEKTTKDGYAAVQVGFDSKRSALINKAQRGHTKDLGDFRFLKEFRTDATFKKGDKIDVSIFKEGDDITVSATSKGKGFQGVVKRHKFKGGPRTHGQKHSEREPGTISGAGRAGGRVAPGMRMAGRMGGDRVTVKNLKVIQINPAENLLLISGAIPGKPGDLIEVVSQ